MLTISDIRSMANPRSFARGQELTERVKSFHVEKDDGYDEIYASVHGSGRNIYDITIRVDLERDMIVGVDCDCPAFYTYDGLCKHCVAVLLTYIEYKKAEKAGSEHDALSFSEMARLGIRKGVSQETTPIMRDLLQQRMLIHMLPVAQEKIYGKVELEPYLQCYDDRFDVEFKIGAEHMYVLKDVFEFIRCVEEKTEHYYGQKLKFIHAMEAFTEEAQELVKFIRAWTEKNGDKYIQNSYYYPRTIVTHAKTRVLLLDGSELEELLRILGHRKFHIQMERRGESLYYVTEEKLAHTVYIEGEKNGIKVGMDWFEQVQTPHYNLYFDEEKIYMQAREDVQEVEDFLKVIEEAPGRRVYIQKEDVPAFCQELLPALETHFECEKQNFDEESYGVTPVTFEIYLDSPQKDFITCKVMAVYGEKKYPVYGESVREGWADYAKEMAVGKVVASYCNAYDEERQMMVLAEDEDRLYDFLVYGIPEIQQLGEVYISDALKRMKVSGAPRVKMGVSLAGDMLELSITSEDMQKEELIEILSRYDRKKKFYRLKSGEFLNMEDEGITALMELKQGLGLTDAQLKKEALEIPKYRALYLDVKMKEWQSVSVSKDRNFKELVRNMKTVEDSDFEIPESLDQILREYQKRGYLWIKTLKQNGFGGILADDMGLGKTLQVITFLLSEYQDCGEKKRCLIVSPASLVYNWSSEIQRFAPQLTVELAVGTAKERRKYIKGTGKGQILITSYELLKRDIAEYEGISFATEIIDEAQYIKNHNTQAAKAVKFIDAGFKLALTGTPVENRLSELWSIFDYLMPGFLYSYQKFRDEMEVPIVQNADEEAMKRLQKMIRPFVLRRLKREVLTDLPDKLEENMYAAMEGEQRKLYDAHVKRMQILLDGQTEEEFKHSKIQILAELTKLRQLCCDPALLYENYKEHSAKVEMCMDLIENAVSGGHKILLFSQFTSMLERLEQCMENRKISFYVLTGATSKEKRARLVEKFNEDDTSVFCISLKAGGTGLNLTAADIVIHFDPWWNVAVQNQATDRAHRIGQKNVVSVYKLITKGTIEENIVKLQDKKQELAEQILAGQGVGEGSFSREELLELLRES